MIGVYLTDLTFLELGNPDFLPDTHFINFDKRRKVFNLIEQIQRYQRIPYALIAVSQIQDFLMKILSTEQQEDFTVLSEDELYDQSLIVEPKEFVEDEEDE